MINHHYARTSAMSQWQPTESKSLDQVMADIAERERDASYDFRRPMARAITEAVATADAQARLELALRYGR